MDTLAYSYLSKALKSFKPKTNPYRLDIHYLKIKRILSTRPNAPSRRLRSKRYSGKKNAYRKKFIAN
jgi:hypothetical protein